MQIWSGCLKEHGASDNLQTPWRVRVVKPMGSTVELTTKPYGSLLNDWFVLGCPMYHVVANDMTMSHASCCDFCLRGAEADRTGN